ncbi:LysR family transcriptional regulator [Mesorhizobium amorphae]|uniref:LysR family transcriptional regulator n=1 Tax=Mesorhizobium amorphae TaxID=71433 RepID=UPI00177ABE16|nr:LysR family transcriptional regulator [Mesorhizobium amorphae]
MLDQSLRCFTEVINAKSIRLAADRIHIAPSAISRRIALLEHTLGTPLIVRTTKGVSPTEQGRLLFEYATRALLDEERFLKEIDDVGALRLGKVSIVAVEATIGRILPQAIQAFRTRFPGIRIAVHIVGAHEVTEALIHSNVDIGVTLNPAQKSEILLRMRWPQPLRAVMRPDHPFAGRQRMSIAELLRHPYALPDRSFGIRVLIEREAVRQSIDLNPTIEANSLQLLKRAVEESDLVTVLPPEAMRLEIEAGTLVAVELVEPPLNKAEICVLTARGRPLTRAAGEMLKCIKAMIADVIIK